MIQKRRLGTNGPLAGELGFGTWPLGGQWGPQDDTESMAALHAAVDAGVTLIDTSPGYGGGRSEQLVAEFLAQRQTPDLLISAKAPPSEGPWPPSPYCRWQDRYSANYLQILIDDLLRRFHTERVGLLQLHSWTRAWNDDPQPLLVLRRLQEEGKVGMVGVCAPENDQHCVIDLMRNGLVDTIQIVFNVFQQEASAQLFSVAEETGTGVIVRAPLDQGSLTGKFPADHLFANDDFRRAYFAGDRLARCHQRLQQIRFDLERLGLAQRYTLTDIALKFAMAPTAVSCVLVGMRNPQQVATNVASTALADLSPACLQLLQRHDWLRGVWYAGK